MLQFFTADSVRIHNELMHASFSRYSIYLVAGLLVFVFAWLKFADR